METGKNDIANLIEEATQASKVALRMLLKMGLRDTSNAETNVDIPDNRASQTRKRGMKRPLDQVDLEEATYSAAKRVCGQFSEESMHTDQSKRSGTKRKRGQDF